MVEDPSQGNPGLDDVETSPTTEPLSPGQAAVVTLKTYPDEPIEAAVVRIGLQAAAPVGDAATFPVILAMSETDLDLLPGMTGRAEIRS